eukprot:365994-Chlamydomonas_euryale.AAC.16
MSPTDELAPLESSSVPKHLREDGNDAAAPDRKVTARLAAADPTWACKVKPAIQQIKKRSQDRPYKVCLEKRTAGVGTKPATRHRMSASSPKAPATVSHMHLSKSPTQLLCQAERRAARRAPTPAARRTHGPVRVWAPQNVWPRVERRCGQAAADLRRLVHRAPRTQSADRESDFQGPAGVWTPGGA